MLICYGSNRSALANGIGSSRVWQEWLGVTLGCVVFH